MDPPLKLAEARPGQSIPLALAKSLAVKHVQASKMQSNIPGAKSPAAEQRGNHALPPLGTS